MYSDPDAALGQAHVEIGALAEENADLRARLEVVQAVLRVWAALDHPYVQQMVRELRVAARGEGDQPAEDCHGCRRATRGGYGSPVLGMCKAHGKAFLGEGDRPLDVEKERF